MLRQGSLSFALIALWIPCPAAVQQTRKETGPTADAAGIARALLATLDEPARASILLPFDAPDRQRWRRDPSPRPGVALRDLDGDQRELVGELLASVLTERGRALVAGIQSEQNLIGRGEAGLGDGYYWLAFHGEPGGGRWGWRLGGHHVSVHATYHGGELAGVTPLLLGGEMDGDPAEDWAGYELLRPREHLARRIALGCGEREWQQAHVRERSLGALALSEPEMQPFATTSEGLSMRDMGADQREALRELIAEYVAPLRSPLGVPSAAELELAAEHVRFAWTGGRAEGEPHSYRIQAPDLLIEYTNSGTHLHTLLRTRLDWGGAVDDAR
jgi:hypothetical protein